MYNISFIYYTIILYIIYTYLYNIYHILQLASYNPKHWLVHLISSEVLTGCFWSFSTLVPQWAWWLSRKWFKAIMLTCSPGTNIEVNNATYLCVKIIVLECCSAEKPFQRIPLLISSTGPTASMLWKLMEPFVRVKKIKEHWYLVWHKYPAAMLYFKLIIRMVNLLAHFSKCSISNLM